MTEKDQIFQLTDLCSKAFEILKQKLIEAPILAHPNIHEPFILDTDASNHSIGGAVLSQIIHDHEHQKDKFTRK